MSLWRYNDGTVSLLRIDRGSTQNESDNWSCHDWRGDGKGLIGLTGPITCQGSGTAGARHTAGGRGKGPMMGEYMTDDARGATTL